MISYLRVGESDNVTRLHGDVNLVNINWGHSHLSEGSLKLGVLRLAGLTDSLVPSSYISSGAGSSGDSLQLLSSHSGSRHFDVLEVFRLSEVNEMTSTRSKSKEQTERNKFRHKKTNSITNSCV